MNNYLKPYYTNIQLSLIVNECNSMDDLKKAGHLVVDLHNDYEIIDVKHFERLAHQRIRQLHGDKA